MTESGRSLQPVTVKNFPDLTFGLCRHDDLDQLGVFVDVDVIPGNAGRNQVIPGILGLADRRRLLFCS